MMVCGWLQRAVGTQAWSGGERGLPRSSAARSLRAISLLSDECLCLLPLPACDCGLRLCNEVTGQCICPPHTIKPECVVCEPQTFGCHPLVGCEDCNCSRPGVQELTEPGCDVDSGQCR